MISVVIGMLIWVLLLSGLLVGQSRRHSQELLFEKSRQHAMCMAMVAEFVGDRFAAKALEAAADHYESMDGQAQLSRIANTLYTPGGPSVPALFLRERALELRLLGPDE